MNHTDEFDPFAPEPEAWDDEGPSKTQRKQAMQALQDLAKQLTELSRDQLKKVPLDDDVREAVEHTRQVRGHEGLRRHMQFLGKMMRRLEDAEVAAIVQQLEIFKSGNKAETAKLHRIEQLRTQLLANDEALTALIQSHPQLDVQGLRTLIRNARREAAQNKPPKSFREIYQVLKTLLDEKPSNSSHDPDAYQPEHE